MFYHRLSVLFFLAQAAVTLSDLATPLASHWGDMQVKHMWDAVPASWESLGHPPAGTTIDLHIALKPHHESALIDALYKVSDPRLPTYGAHLSREQVAELVAPHPDTLGLVTSWLGHHGVAPSSISITHGGGWLTATGVPLSQANKLLGASYQHYRHVGTNRTTIRTVGYALPAALHGHVQTVAPTTYFSHPRKPQQTPRKRPRKKAAAKAKARSGELVSGRDDDEEEEGEPEEETEENTLEFLRWLYNTQSYVPAAMDRNAHGVVGHQGQSPSQEDLAVFMNQYRTEAEDATFKVVQINDGLLGPSEPDERLEANTNLQYAEGMAYPTPHIFYSIGGSDSWYIDTGLPRPEDSDLVWLKHLLNLENVDIPQTISIAYGSPEKTYPKEYTKAICDLYAELGARGVSIIFASGDDGVGLGNCKDPESKDPEKVQFIPFFPASCPWVTSVGGTTKYQPEEAASLSGGGFSFHFPRPEYQNRAVPDFLNDLGKEKYAGLYDPDGRGIPDISAQALDFLVIVNPHVKTVDGTSCAAPTVAGIISLLNDYLLTSGKEPLGFLNPWLYDKGLPGLNDIISGNNPGCGTEGFSAIIGWDPVTGLGTPDFEELQETLADRPVVSSIASASYSSMPPTPT